MQCSPRLALDGVGSLGLIRSLILPYDTNSNSRLGVSCFLGQFLGMIGFDFDNLRFSVFSSCFYSVSGNFTYFWYE